MRKMAIKRLPAYMIAGYITYNDYLLSESWQKKKADITRRFPYSKYCWICDTTKNLNLHHENYWSIPEENYLKGDVLWLCQNCHSMVHRLDTGEKTPLEKHWLEKRRKELRKEYLRRELKSSTLLYFLGRVVYRSFW